jgi:hypothetical protein
MTTDQLERDLKTLAEPRPEDEHLRLAVRATLAEQLHRRPTVRRRTRFVFGSAAVTAAAAAAALVAVLATGGSPSANAAILAHVVRATDPPANMIVHVKEVGDGVSAEWWQETNAPYAQRLIKGPTGYETETAVDGTNMAQYDAATDTVYEQPDSTPPVVVDPIETLRAGLKNGTAQIDGTVTIDGQSLYKLELPNGVVGYFDRTDYRPVYIDNPQRDGGRVERTRVVAYEELPLTSANDRLLSVAAQHPGARVAHGEPPAPTKDPGATK